MPPGPSLPEATHIDGRAKLRVRLIIALAAFIPYLQTLWFEFAYDDVLQITLNPQVIDTHSIPQLLFEATPPGNLYRPLTTLTYVLNFRLSALDPGPYHALNCVLYVLCCLTLFSVARRLTTFDIAAWGTFLFALHPLHGEVVANVIGRAEILAAIFALLAVSAFIRPITMGLPLSVLAWIAAALSKESALSLMLILPFLDDGGKPSRRWMRSAAVGTATAISYAALRYAALGTKFRIQSDPSVIWAENPLSHLSFAERLVPALKTLGDYIRMMVFPTGLSADYSMMPDEFLAEVYSLRGAAALTILLLYILLLVVKRGARESVFGWWALAAFALTANILSPIGTIMGDRLAFLPSAGMTLFLASLTVGLLPVFHRLVLALIACGYTEGLLARVPVWRDNFTLFSRTVVDVPRSPKAHYNLGVEYLIGRHRDLEKAAEEFRTTLAINPTHLFAIRGLADIALEKRELGRLEYWYRRILEVSPNNETARKQLDELLLLKTKQ